MFLISHFFNFADMDAPFDYFDYVTGPHFIGREKEVSEFCRLIEERRNILIYNQARTGKKSIIYNSFRELDRRGYRYALIGMNLFNIRCIETFMIRYTNHIVGKFARSGMEWSDYLMKYIPSAPYIVKEREKPGGTPYFTYNSKELLSDAMICEFLNLPERIATDLNCHIVLYFEQFQDISLFDDSDRIFSLFEKMWSRHSHVSYIITGERKNAMDEIFEQKKYFYNLVEQIEVVPIERRVFVNHIVKRFLKGGKVIRPEQAGYIYDTLEGDPWYVQHLSSICYDMTIGYLEERTIDLALRNLINLHDFSFHTIAFGLSKHQLRFIKALLDGVKKFSSADILDKYKLNSSANVNRLKEALQKKEIITYNKNRAIVIMDPLLKHWFIKYYFEK